TQNKMRNHDCAERQKQLNLTHLRDTPEGKPFVIKIEPDILTDCSDIQKSSRRPNGWWFNPEPVCGRVTPESKRFDRKRQRKHPADHLPASQLFGQDPSFRVAVRTRKKRQQKQKIRPLNRPEPRSVSAKQRNPRRP